MFNKKPLSILASIALAASLCAFAPAAYASQSSGLKVAAEQFETGDSMEGAMELELGADDIWRSHSSSISTDSGPLWYKFNTFADKSVYDFGFGAYKTSDEGAIAPSGEQIRVSLLDSNGKVVKSGEGYEFNWRLSGTLKKNVDYYLKLEIAASDGGYHETGYEIRSHACNVLEKVVLKGGVSAKKNSAVVKWKKQASATKYQVRYKTAKGKYVMKTTTKNQINLTKLKKGTKYYVSVRAYCKGAFDSTGYNKCDWGEWSKTKAFKTKQ